MPREEDATREAQRVLGEDFAQRIELERRRVERLLVEFAEQRRIFFLQAEGAVIRLSLLVAAKIPTARGKRGRHAALSDRQKQP